MGWGIALGVILGGALGLSVGAFLSGAELATIAGLAIAPLTAGLVGLTWFLGDETRKSRLEQRHPHLIVTLEPNEHHIDFLEVVIDNIGLGMAYDVQVSFQPEIRYQNGIGSGFLSDASILKLPALKPGQRFKQFIARYDEFLTHNAIAICECRDVDGFRHCDKNKIDLDALLGYGKLGKDSLLRLADSSEKIEHAVSQIVRGAARISVDQFTAEDRKQEQEIQKQRRKEMRERRDAEKLAAAATEGASPPETAPTKPSPHPEN